MRVTCYFTVVQYKGHLIRAEPVLYNSSLNTSMRDGKCDQCSNRTIIKRGHLSWQEKTQTFPALPRRIRTGSRPGRGITRFLRDGLVTWEPGGEQRRLFTWWYGTAVDDFPTNNWTSSDCCCSINLTSKPSRGRFEGRSTTVDAIWGYCPLRTVRNSD